MRTLRLGIFIGCATLTSMASAAPTDFSAGSWIIPMDVCYQPSEPFCPGGSPSTCGSTAFSTTALSSTVYGSSCPDKSSTVAKDGVLKAYGLVYDLLAAGVPVYYILNTSKTAIDDTDLTITSSSGTPVALLNHSTLAQTEFMNATHTSISYRGAPFIVSASDVTTAGNLLKSNATFTVTDTRTGRGVFQDVYIHVAKTNILQAPVKAIMLQTPPKIALLDIGGAAIGVLQGYLQDAGLYVSGSVAAYPTIGNIFTQFDNVSDFTGGGLTNGGFSILWAPHWEGDQLTTSQRDSVMQYISNFIDAGHPFLAQCAAAVTFEGGTAVNTSGYGGQAAPDTSYAHFMTTASVNQMGLKTNQISQSSAFPASTAQKIVVNTDSTVKAWIDPLTQVGDYTMALDELSWMFDFTPSSGYAYKTGVKQYVVTTSTSPTSYNGLDVETVTYKDNSTSKGQIIYLGGHSYGTQGSTCSGTCSTFSQLNNIALERLVLNSLIFLGQVNTSSEQTRSSPIVYTPGGTFDTSLAGDVFLGSYVQQTSPSAAFPPWTGHFREYPSGSLVGTNVSAFGSVSSNWDSYNSIKAQSASDARNIYTAVYASGAWSQIPFTTANLSKISTYCGSTYSSSITSTNLTAIRTGYLGGIDHSIPAIVYPSLSAGSSTRPVVAYVGALDGMIHAILVYGTVTGKNPGDELWAFIPPSQLCKTFTQTAGVDGSPNVGDAFVSTGTSTTRSWRTLLAIPDNGYAGGTLDVLDVTNVTDSGNNVQAPTWLWEASDTFTSSGKTYVLGRAQGAAISPINTTAGVSYAFFVATDNTNGTAGNGFNMYALDAGTGSVIWRFNHTYTSDTTHNDVPGALAVVDSAGDSGPADKVYFGDIEGKLWAVSAGNGATQTMLLDNALAHGASGSVNYAIESGITLYRDPTTKDLDILGVTGGADWVPSTTLSYIFKYDTNTNTATPSLVTLGTNERIYAVPTVSGNSAYVISSLGQLQTAIGNSFSATGNLIRVDLGTGASTTLATVKQGASEVAVDSTGNVIAASATGITENGNSGHNTATSYSLQNGTQKLTKVRAWLDWH
jgi:hypothetical protein